MSSIRRSARARRLAVRSLGGLGLALALGGCSLVEKAPTPVACPEVLVDANAARMVSFGDRTGRDLTDVTMEATILQLTGDCAVDIEADTVDVRFKVLFEVSRGPAMTGYAGDFSYFVAIPAFYPAPEGKQTFDVGVKFPESNVTTIRVRDEEVRLTIPLKGRTPKDTPVFVGFQLTADQLRYIDGLSRR